MPKFKVEWYIDFLGMDEIRAIEVEAKDEDDAREQVCHILISHWAIGEIGRLVSRTAAKCCNATDPV